MSDNRALVVPYLFYSQATPLSVRICVRLSGAAAESMFTGDVIGPFCDYAHTLPTRFPMVPTRSEGFHAEAIVPDPCYWSAERPMRYRVSVELRESESPDVGQRTQAWSFDYGVRSLQVQGKHFFLEGRRWVMRGLSVDGLESFDAERWRDASAVMMLTNPSDAICREASAKGVWIIARMTTADAKAELHRVTSWPAVAIVVLGSDVVLDDQARRLAANVVLAQQIDARSTEPIASWAQAVVADVGDQPAPPSATGSSTLPIIALRRLAAPASGISERVAKLRRECDHLQRDMTKWGDFSGYLVEPSR